MFKIYFGDFSDGRLLRLPYLGYTLLLIALFIGFVFATVLVMGAAENLMGGELADAQRFLMKSLGIPYMIIFGLIFLAVFIGSMNVMAKRARDIGLPGWLSVLVFFIASVAISVLISDDASNALSTIVGFGLLLTPSNTFGGNQK